MRLVTIAWNDSHSDAKGRTMKENRLLRRVILSILLVALAGPALAQRITGQIEGVITDQQGGNLPGVTVTLTGPALPGSKVTQSNENGLYRFIALPPGEYQAVFALQGFKEETRTGLRAGVGATRVENVQLTVGDLTESITVTGESAPIDTTSNEVGTNYSREWVENAPVARQSFNDLVAAAPGSLRGDNDSRRTMVYGSSYDENSFQLDGADVNDNFFNEQLAEPNIDAIQEIEVLSLGAPAEYGNLTGAVYNIVTRQGTNEFSGDFNYFYQSDSLTDENVEVRGFNYQREKYNDWTVQLGGPIARDRAFFFVSYQNQEDGFSNVGVDPLIGTIVEENERLFAKVNFQINDSHSLVASFHQDDRKDPSALAIGEAPSTAFTAETKTPTPGLGYSGVLSDKTLVEARFSGFYGEVTLGPSDPNQPRDLTRFINLDTGELSGGHYYWYELEPTRTTINAKVSHLADDFLGGDHDFRFGVQYHEAEAGGIYGYNDLVLTYDVGGTTYGYGYTRLPFSYSGNTEGLGLFVDDTWRVNDRLTLNVGVRYDRNEAFSKEQPDLDENGDPTGIVFPATDFYTWKYVSPRLGLNYVLTADGKTVLKVHAGRYHRAIATGEFANSIGPSIKPNFFGLYDSASNSLFDLQQITDNSNLSVDPDYKSPHTDQFIVSLERQFGRNIGVNVNAVFKRGRDYAAWQDVGGIYEDVIYLDPITGNSIPVKKLLNDRSDLSFVITNRDEMDTDIFATSINVVKSMSNNWSLNSSLTYLKSEGRTPDSLGPAAAEQRGGLQFRVFGRNPNDFVNTDGRLRGDVPWQFKTQFVYQLPRGFLFATNVAFRSGANRVILVRLPASLVNVSSQILAEKRGESGRLDSATFVDMRLEKSFQLRNDFELALTLDLFNVLNEDVAEGVVSSLGSASTFNNGDNFVLPRRAMLGVKFRF
jgi:outer membrane receptor protein involved in Fe transport